MVRHPTVVDAAGIGQFDEIVDVRSPSEYALDHVPGAVNCPVLSDEERARVGTLYKQTSQFQARRLGAALVANNIARHLQGYFAGKERGWRPLVYCWRGGKRSGAMAHVLSEVGWRAAALQGGYRGYRSMVLSQLESLPARLQFCVLCGPTGSGKSRLLELLREAGTAQVLDLEALARHRGSVLGDLPGDPQPSQKMFDSLVWHALSGFDAARPVLVEAESRTIGVLRVPEALLARMRASPTIVVAAPLSERVHYLLREYRHFLSEPAWLKQRLGRLTALHSRDTVARWTELIERAEWQPLVADLLARHYDPAYRKSTDAGYPALATGAVLEVPRLDPAALAVAASALAELCGSMGKLPEQSGRLSAVVEQ